MAYRIVIHRDTNKVVIRDEHDMFVCDYAAPGRIESAHYNGDDTFTLNTEGGHGAIFDTRSIPKMMW